MTIKRKVKLILLLLIILSSLSTILFFSFPKDAFSKETLIARHDEGGGEGALTPEEIEEKERKKAAEFWELDYPWNPPKPNLPEYINYIYKFSFWVGAFLAIIMIIIGGIEWSGAAANPQLKAAAKNKITRSIIGLITLFSIFIILNTINPDLTSLKDLKDITTSEEGEGILGELKKGIFKYKIDGNDIETEIAKGKIEGLPQKDENDKRYSKIIGVYFSVKPLSGESDEPCECQAEYVDSNTTYCGNYCFHVCRRFISGPDNIDGHLYGTINGARCGPWNNFDTPKGDVVECNCYEAFNDTFSETKTFRVDDACECSGDQTPLCYNKDHDFCMDYCKRVENYKFGYTSFCEEQGDQDTVMCTCIK